MACFLAPLTLAVITTFIQKTARSLAEKIKLGILNLMLWGGAILLMIEHIWHGEVVPWPPFLTAMKNPHDFAVMIHEITTVGISLNIASIVAWLTILGALKLYMSRIKTPGTTKITPVKPQ